MVNHCPIKQFRIVKSDIQQDPKYEYEPIGGTEFSIAYSKYGQMPLNKFEVNLNQPCIDRYHGTVFPRLRSNIVDGVEFEFIQNIED